MSKLTELNAEIKACTRCDLYKTRVQSVPGVGPDNARIMLIGEAPGAHEDTDGEPFVGRAGEHLTHLLELAQLKRQDLYITNVVKSRPPKNRDPRAEEIEACSIWLDRQLALIKPKLIITLGKYAMDRWFPGKRISEIRGQPYWFGELVVVPMFHPARALHRPENRELIEADFRMLGSTVREVLGLP